MQRGGIVRQNVGPVLLSKTVGRGKQTVAVQRGVLGTMTSPLALEFVLVSSDYAALTAVSDADGGQRARMTNVSEGGMAVRTTS